MFTYLIFLNAEMNETMQPCLVFGLATRITVEMFLSFSSYALLTFYCFVVPF